MAEGRFNLKNPSIKRILQETKEMQNNPSDDYLSLPLEDDIFEWQFAIRGPPDTEFEGGIYHGRIQLPPDYPFKPPSFMLLSPNGRFETQTKICLSISQYHPEHWQPSWSVRTALLALIAFMPTKGNGAIGSLELSKEERRALAIKSRQTPPKYGNEERQKLITEIHERMMKSDGKLDSLPSATENGLEVAGKKDDSELEILKNPALVGNGVGSESAPSSNIIAGMENLSENEGEQVSDLSPTPPELTRASDNNELLEARGVTRPQVRPRPSDDWALTLLAIGLSVAFLALLLNKILKSHGGWLKF